MKKYLAWMIAVGLFICVIWFVFSHWLMTLSGTHDWLSSFVEIAFALNAAISFEKIRGHLTPLQDMFDKRVNEQQRKYKDQRKYDRLFKYIKKRLPEIFSEIEHKACCMLNWTVNFARLSCFACIITLLVYESGRNVMYVPTLIFPCILYCVGDVCVMLMIANDVCALFNEALENSGVKLSH